MKTPDARLYVLAATNNCTGIVTVFPLTPMLHKEARTMLSKFTYKPARHVHIIEWTAKCAT